MMADHSSSMRASDVTSMPGARPRARINVDAIRRDAGVRPEHQSAPKRPRSAAPNLRMVLLSGATRLPLDEYLTYVASFGGNSFYERILLFITDKQRRYARKLPYLGDSKGVEGSVPMSTIRSFTLMQLVILGVIFLVTRLPFVKGIFPLLIAVLVPLRIYGMPRMFGASNVDALDWDGNSAEAAPASPPPTAVGVAA